MKRILFNMFIIIAVSIVQGQTPDKENNYNTMVANFKVEGMTC